MALGRNGKNGKQDQAEEAITLTPEQAHEAALLSLAAWMQELKVRREVLEEAERELRLAGKYPPQHGFAGVFDQAERAENWMLHNRPELFGGPPKLSRAREMVNTCKADYQNALAGYDRVRKLLEDGIHDNNSQRDQAFMAQLTSWSTAVRQARENLQNAYSHLGDETTSEDRKARLELAKAGEETITLKL